MLPVGRIMRGVYRALVLRQEGLPFPLWERLQDPLRVKRIFTRRWIDRQRGHPLMLATSSSPAGSLPFLAWRTAAAG